jgi:hypothetical protein
MDFPPCLKRFKKMNIMNRGFQAVFYGQKKRVAQTGLATLPPYPLIS